MSPLRKTALVVRVFYLLTFFSIPTLFLYNRCGTIRRTSSAQGRTLPASSAGSWRSS